MTHLRLYAVAFLMEESTSSNAHLGDARIERYHTGCSRGSDLQETGLIWEKVTRKL